MRVIAVFEKTARLRHIGHLDIMRAVERALRRSGLPIGYSKGFNPHVLVTFASALSTGSAGLNEIMDVTMEEDVTADEFLAAMNAALPRDMQLKSARVIDQRHPALMAMTAAACYDIQILDAEKAAKMTAAIPAFMAQESIITPRRTKSGIKDCDARPLIYDLHAEGHHLVATLCLTERESCKTDMIITALSAFTGVEPPRVMVTRTAILGKNEQGEYVPLETL